MPECPACGGPVRYEGRCGTCQVCGVSTCYGGPATASENNPMTHESRLARGEGAEPTTSSVQLQSRNPTPMVSNTVHTQSNAETNTNDAKWLYNSDVPEKITEYIEARASLTKSWFKPKYIARALELSPRVIGPALAAMYRSDDYPFVVERRSADGCFVYRVEVEV